MRVGLGGIVGGEEQEDLRLHRIGGLELVDEEVGEARLQLLPHRALTSEEITGPHEEIEEIELPRAGFAIFVEGREGGELALKERCEVGLGAREKRVELGARRTAQAD